MSWGNPKSLSEQALVKLLWPASFSLGGASYLRMMAYNKGVMKQRQFPANIISIGNITCGGTGKTPVTIDLAQRLVASGRKVAVLSRGYKRLSTAKFLVVSDGQRLQATCADSGDEPYLIATRVPDATVIVGAKRIDTAMLAIDKFGCDTILLDDGFQHFAIARNTDVVLVDYNDELGNDHLLPAGRLREPLTALARADWIVITKVPANPDTEKLSRIRQLLLQFAPKAKVSECQMVAETLSPFGYPEITLSAATVKDTRIFAFCAIARPEPFLQQLRAMGANIVGTKTMPDHHWYTHQDILSIRSAYQATSAEMVITTEKDSVKLLPDMVKDLPLTVLQQVLKWTGTVPAMPHPLKKQPV